MPADLPEVQEEEGNPNARAKAAIIPCAWSAGDRPQQGGTIGTTGGIPPFQDLYPRAVRLRSTNNGRIICCVPCHQSTFDLADSGNVVFGPAARRLPQLPITIDPEGFLVAADGFAEPVGPSFWERGDA